jgi:hypothetical protein
MPSSWTATINPKKHLWRADFKRREIQCSVGLKPPEWDPERKEDRLGLLPEYPIQLIVVRAPFSVAARNAGFTKYVNDETGLGARVPNLKLGDWTIDVRQGDALAKQLRTACCQIVIGDTWGHATTTDGSTATVTETIAVVNDHHHHSAIISGDDAYRFGEITGAIARSFEFHK